MTREILYSETEIQARVGALADTITAASDPPERAAPILAGAFVFAADLLRALARRGLPLPVEFLWLRSYADARESAGSVAVLASPGQGVRDRHVLLIDGVLDGGHTLQVARGLLAGAGARRITSVVVVDKRRKDAVMRADHAAFTDVKRFIVGYGMDDRGEGRALPYIAAVD